MRGGAVGVAHAEGRDVYAVERIRVAGAEDVLDGVALCLRGRADAAHQAGFAGARPSLYNAQEIVRPGAEAVIERVKAGIGVRSEKIAGN